MSHHPKLSRMAAAATDLTSALLELMIAWEEAEIEALDRGGEPAKEALHLALCEGYPLSGSLEDIHAAADEWEDHVSRVMDNPPGSVQHAAILIRHAVTAAEQDMTEKRVLSSHPDADSLDAWHTRQWQTGGLGGPVGALGAMFPPSVALNVAALLEAVAGGDLDAARQHSQAIAGKHVQQNA